MVRVNWTFQAKEDLKNIAFYISKDSKQYAKLQIYKISSAAKYLKSHIRIGKIVSELDNIDIRELVKGNYRIIYRIVSEDRIDILTVHHSARDLSGRNIR